MRAGPKKTNLKTNSSWSLISDQTRNPVTVPRCFLRRHVEEANFPLVLARVTQVKSCARDRISCVPDRVVLPVYSSVHNVLKYQYLLSQTTAL